MVDRRTMRTLPKIAKRRLPGFAKLAPVVAAVDSAKHAPAWALAEGGELTACAFDGAPGNASPLPHAHELGAGHVVVPMLPDVCVLEASRSYGSKDHGKHGDILAEAIGGALCAGSMRAGEVVLIAPDEWAGSGPKPPRHSAVWEALTYRERALVKALYRPQKGDERYLENHIERACEALSYSRKPAYSNPIHNILDAVGLLLFAVGRIGRAGAKLKAQRPRVTFAGLDSGRTIQAVTVTGSPFRGRVVEKTGVSPLKLNKKRFLRA